MNKSFRKIVALFVAIAMSGGMSSEASAKESGTHDLLTVKDYNVSTSYEIVEENLENKVITADKKNPFILSQEFKKYEKSVVGLFDRLVFDFEPDVLVYNSAEDAANRVNGSKALYPKGTRLVLTDFRVLERIDGSETDNSEIDTSYAVLAVSQEAFKTGDIYSGVWYNEIDLSVINVLSDEEMDELEKGHFYGETNPTDPENDYFENDFSNPEHPELDDPEPYTNDSFFNVDPYSPEIDGNDFDNYGISFITGADDKNREYSI